MVVKGRRETALPNVPELTSRTPPSDGFFMEVNRPSPFELPDHWIPFYGVGLQIGAGGTRYYFQGGKHREERFKDGDSLVIAPQELRRFRSEIKSGQKLILVSIEPVVLQHMVAGSPREQSL